ncbi:MAG: flagellar protein FlgN [Oscillospiraceae bacterium]|jgi:flagellar biosynthesis/type III secretory pathway chaperone|nr:flagellar protein FlgN [Oscillospiraceae bacterium]
MTALPELAARFLAVMRSEYDVHGALLRLSSEKREAVAGSAVSALNDIVRAEQVLLSQLSALERRRLACAEELSRAAGIAPEDVTMLSFAEYADEGQKRELTELRAGLQKLFKELREANDINSRLLRTGLLYIESILGATPSEPDAYDSRGSDIAAAPGRGGRHSIDKKV